MQPANSRAPAPRSPSPGCRVIHGVGDTGTDPPPRHCPPLALQPPAATPQQPPLGPPAPSGEIPAAGGRGDPARLPGIPLQHHSPPPPLRLEGGRGGEGIPGPRRGAASTAEAGRSGGWGGRMPGEAAGGRLEALAAAADRSEPSRSLRPRTGVGGSTAGQPQPCRGAPFCAGLSPETRLLSPPGWLLQGAAPVPSPAADPRVRPGPWDPRTPRSALPFEPAPRSGLRT